MESVNRQLSVTILADGPAPETCLSPSLKPGQAFLSLLVGGRGSGPRDCPVMSFMGRPFPCASFSLLPALQSPAGCLVTDASDGGHQGSPPPCSLSTSYCPTFWSHTCSPTLGSSIPPPVSLPSMAFNNVNLSSLMALLLVICCLAPSELRLPLMAKW